MVHEENKDIEKIEVNKISEMIEYQSGGIVSKQIIKKPNGNLTLFGFDKGESLTEHTSPFEAVVNIIEGEMEITIGGKPYNVKAGEMIIMPPNIPHGLVAKEKTKMFLTMIKN
ncbi:MAG: cupin domain-containing protein [Melioribacteraceae bacterium]|jgi:quercetin dioxygenase-like cupin family protein|nr:cupin domain-containing protein [Melioribacteraceae bacterium]WKZ70107.1 MAG: cupin domain-containing protein [Melioribacteraceae bacterium]